MKAAVVMVEHVYLPGVHSDLMVSREQGEALDRLWKREGFGCLEVVLCASSDTEAPQGPENLNPIGALVEVVVDQKSLRDGSHEVGLEIADGHRVKLEQPQKVTQVYGVPFDGIMTGYKGCRPATAGFDDWNRLKQGFYTWLLAQEDESRLDFAAATILEIERLHAPDWKLAYMVADRLLKRREDRLALLAYDDVGSGVVELELERLLLDRDSDSALAGFTELIEESLEIYLEPTRATLEAASLLAKMELISLPRGTSRALKGIERELERLGVELEDLVVELKAMRRRGG